MRNSKSASPNALPSGSRWKISFSTRRKWRRWAGLAGGVAHDFNNLLTVILGYNEMLRDRVSQDGAAMEYSDEVLHAAERASALTNQLLAFSRRQVAIPRVVDLNEIVLGIDKMLRRIIGEDIQLETRLSRGLPAVKVDPSHIDQVIMNLAVNSRDAMPDGGTLTIETAEVDLTAEYAGRHIGVERRPLRDAGRERHRKRYGRAPPRRGCSSHFSPPRKRARAPDWGSPSYTASSSRTAARSWFTVNRARARRSKSTCLRSWSRPSLGPRRRGRQCDARHRDHPSGGGRATGAESDADHVGAPGISRAGSRIRRRGSEHHFQIRRAHWTCC